MKTWENGALGGTVQKIIEENFAELESAINRLSSVYTQTFKSSEWRDGSIFIDAFRYNKIDPSVELYIKQPVGYEPVIGGYKVSNSGVELQSDIAFDGKVVIK